MRWLTRVRLERDVPAAALAHVLLPDDPSDRCQTAHRLLWTLFADDPARRRDFLWREERPGRGTSGRGGFLVLSEREPLDQHGLFDMDPPKAWSPALAQGDRLAFSLRANPVVTRKNAAGRTQRHDVVMDRMREIPRDCRATARDGVMREAGRAWLDRQASAHGFAVLVEEDGETEEKRPLLRIDGYEQLRIARPREKPARLSVLEFDGVIEVREPDRFIAALHRGFGKAKAWGCGLMLIRRA